MNNTRKFLRLEIAEIRALRNLLRSKLSADTRCIVATESTIERRRVMKGLERY